MGTMASEECVPQKNLWTCVSLKSPAINLIERQALEKLLQLALFHGRDAVKQLLQRVRTFIELENGTPVAQLPS
jgi:hypothetical protein